MKSKPDPRRGRVMRRVRAVARKAHKRVTASPPLLRPMPEPRETPEHSVLHALKTEYQRIKDEIRHHEALTQDHSETSNDIGDEASEVFEQTKNLALKRHLEKMLQQIEAAIRRIEAGTYGFCERCGELINPERLQALPSATMCMGCARAAPRAA